MFMPDYHSNNFDAPPSPYVPTSKDVPPYTPLPGRNYQQFDPAIVHQLLAMLTGPGAFHPGAVHSGYPKGTKPPMGVAQPRESVPLTSLVTPVNSAVSWRATAKVADCEDTIKQKERVLNHDFSPENIDAELRQLQSLPKTIKRLSGELNDANARLAELQTLEPHMDECVEIRRRQHQATHSGKRQRLTPLERDLANSKKQAEEAEEEAADANFIAPEDPKA
jgi:hypothetical protein